MSMFLALCATIMLASCASAPDGSSYVNASEPSIVPSVEIPEESVPSASFEESVTNVHSDETDDEDEIDYVRFMKDADYADRCIADELAAIVGIKSKPEKYSSKCVVDMRGNDAAYDVDWD